MPSPTSILKRLVVGRPFRSDRLQHTLLPKRIALPVFASDALSSVAYAPDEVLLTLSVAGVGAYAYSPWIGLAVVAVMLTVVASYRQNVHAYPSGGGDYEVVTVNLGPRFGLVVASALLVDYVLTVAVSVSSGVQNLGSAVPWIQQNRVEVAVAVVIVLAAMNLRGIREAGTAFAFPTYAFMISILGMVGWGLFQIFVLRHPLRAESAGLQIRATAPMAVGSFAFAFLLARAFSSGSAALTGVEAISNGVPAFRRPKSRNAATTLLMLGLIAVTMLMGIIMLSRLTHLRYVLCPTTGPGCPSSQFINAPARYVQETVTAQLGRAVFAGFLPLFYVVVGTTALILVLAANTAFNGFPVLGSILAQDRYMPRQLHTRGDRLAFSNGIMFLASFAVVLIIGFQAEVTRLIQLYIVGVFVSFTLSQTGMLRHWNRLLRTERDRRERRRMVRSRTINGFGLIMTGFVLVLVLATKFTKGAWISIAAMTVIYLVMLGIRRHYDRVAAELVPAEERPVLPARNHAIVLVSKVHAPTMRAVSYALGTRPDTLAAVTVNVDEAETRALQAAWEDSSLRVPLIVIDSPYREIARPVIDYVKSIRRQSPRDVVTVFIPEYVVGRWWEHLLHNQSALRLKTRLLYEPGVMVTSVAWQLASSSRKNLRRYDRGLARTPVRDPRSLPGDGSRQPGAGALAGVDAQAADQPGNGRAAGGPQGGSTPPPDARPPGTGVPVGW